ncbi:aminopeptidase [Paenibacillus sambharensis]|nr:aminopeptidase [Paenibacillus sambharensis]
MYSDELEKVASFLVHDSLLLQPGERVLVDSSGDEPLTPMLVRKIYDAGAFPIVKTMTTATIKEMIRGSSRESLLLWSRQELSRLKSMDAYINMTADRNMYEMEDVPPDRLVLYYKLLYQPILAAAAAKPKWLLLHYPTDALAQLAQMSLDQLQAMFVRSCDYAGRHLQTRYLPVSRLLERTSRVRIVSPGTELTFSIEGQASRLCDGSHNFPGGEIFTAPLLDSVNGAITFNVPFHAYGRCFRDIRLEFCEGRVVDVTCSDTRAFLALMGKDDGASRVGEFGIGLNPAITSPIGTPAYDEKMAGSIHLALGNSYSEAGNGNVSTVHMDLVLSQLTQHGGGALYFDETLVRHNGIFTLPELQHLNEELEEGDAS